MNRSVRRSLVTTACVLLAAGLCGVFLPDPVGTAIIPPAAATCTGPAPETDWVYPKPDSTAVPLNADLSVAVIGARTVLLDDVELEPRHDLPWGDRANLVFDLGTLSPETTYNVQLLRAGFDPETPEQIANFDFTTGSDSYQAPNDAPQSAVISEVDDVRLSAFGACSPYVRWRECFDTGPPPGLGFREYVSEMEAVMWVVEIDQQGVDAFATWACPNPLYYSTPPSTADNLILHAVRADGSVLSSDVILGQSTLELLDEIDELYHPKPDDEDDASCGMVFGRPQPLPPTVALAALIALAVCGHRTRRRRSPPLESQSTS